MRSVRNVLPVALVAISIGCSRQTDTGANVDKAFRLLIWPESKIIASLDIKRLKNTGLYRKHQRELEAAWSGDVSERLGVDLRRDVDYVGFSSDGTRSLLFAKGNFNAKAVESKLAAQGAERMSSGKYTLLGKQGNALTFLSDRVVIAGSPTDIRAAIALEDKGTGEVPEQLEEQLRSLGSDDQLWVVSRGGLPLGQAPLRGDTQANLANITRFVNNVTIGLAADTGIHLGGTLACNSPEGATRVHDALRGAIGLMRLSTKDNETDLLKIYDAFQVSKSGNLVRLRADLATEQTERLVGLIPQLGRRAPL